MKKINRATPEDEQHNNREGGERPLWGVTVELRSKCDGGQFPSEETAVQRVVGCSTRRGHTDKAERRSGAE